MSTWVIIGFIGQFIFGMRFVVQWIASERAQESVIPNVFWYLSILGSLTLLTYAIHRRDPVFIAGQAGGSFIYIRNLVLIKRNQDEEKHLEEE